MSEIIELDITTIDKMKVVELKSKLKSFGLSTSGLKAELNARLKMYVSDVSEVPSSETEFPNDVLVNDEMVTQYLNEV